MCEEFILRTLSLQYAKRPDDAVNMTIEVSSSMISGNGGIVQSIAYAASLTFIYGSAKGGLITQPRAGFLRGRQGSKCR